MTERMINEADWGYIALVLANAEVAERGKLACIDTANSGIIVKGKTATGLIPLGIFHESLTGDGVKKVQIKLFSEIHPVWWDNDTVAAVASTDRGKLCYVKDDATVTITSSGHSIAGMVLDVVTAKGVLVLAGYKTW
jgi:hypothetical protein